MSTFLYYLSLAVLASISIAQFIFLSEIIEANTVCSFSLILGIILFVVLYFFDKSSRKIRHLLGKHFVIRDPKQKSLKYLRIFYLLAFLGCTLVGSFFSYATIPNPRLNYCVWFMGPSIITLGIAFLLKFFESKNLSKH